MFMVTRIKRKLLLLLLPFMLAQCSDSKGNKCGFIETDIIDICGQVDLLERCDIYCLLSFDSPIGKSFPLKPDSGFYYTKYSVTVYEKYKGEEDVTFVTLLYDQERCHKTSSDREVELGKLYFAYLNYSTRFQSYELSSSCPESLTIYNA